MNELKDCVNFSEYIDLLKACAHKYTIILAVTDALEWTFDHQDILNSLSSIGLSSNLHNSKRKSYIAVLDKGNVIFEKLAKDYSEALAYSKDAYKIISKGFSCGNSCIIQIDGTDYATNKTGLNIVVWDNNANALIDSVAVNMLREQIVMTRSTPNTKLDISAYSLAKQLMLLKRYGINSLIYFTPIADDVKNPSIWEKELIRLHSTQGIVSKNIDKYFVMSGMNTEYTYEEFKEHLCHPCRVVKHKSYIKNAYQSDKDLNINIDGLRLVTDMPSQWDFTIHVFGDSVGLIWEIKDSDTFQSNLQRMLNLNSEHKVRILNYCVAGSGFNHINDYILDTNIQSGDIIIILLSGEKKTQLVLNALNLFKVYDIEIKNLQYAFDRPHDYGEVFFDRIHPNHNGHKCLALEAFKDILKVFKSRENNSTLVSTTIKKGCSIPNNDELILWLKNISSYKKRIGSIVMNCNPFTLGHRYLIETAAAQCLHLYIFVVEEDKSVFKFEDRFNLVKQGTSDLANVTVLPSGRYIISQLTFEEYFGKSEMQDTIIDPSFDVELFATYIAPTLGINVRFAGEEPIDMITKQYNDKMKEILPQHGIEFIEISRKACGEDVISASRVRKLLERNDFGEIAKLVPETTLVYLKEISH